MPIRKALLGVIAILAAIVLIAGLIYLIRKIIFMGIILTLTGLIALFLCLLEYVIIDFEETLH